MSGHTDIDRLVVEFFSAFDSGPGCADRLDRLRELFLPQAVIVKAGSQWETYDVEGFLAPRRALLLGGALQEFREWETSGHTDLTGELAQRRSSYAKSWLRDGEPHTGRGHKMIQLVRAPEGWRISALAWQDETT